MRSFCPAVVLHLALVIHSSCIKEIAQVSCTEEPHVDASVLCAPSSCGDQNHKGATAGNWRQLVPSLGSLPPLVL